MQSRALLPSVFSATTFTALQRRHVDLMFVALLAAATPALTYLEAANGTLPGAAEIAAGTHVHSPPFTLLYGQQANFSVTALTFAIGNSGLLSSSSSRD